MSIAKYGLSIGIGTLKPEISSYEHSSFREALSLEVCHVKTQKVHDYKDHFFWR